MSKHKYSFSSDDGRFVRAPKVSIIGGFGKMGFLLAELFKQVGCKEISCIDFAESKALHQKKLYDNFENFFFKKYFQTELSKFIDAIEWEKFNGAFNYSEIYSFLIASYNNFSRDYREKFDIRVNENYKYGCFYFTKEEQESIMSKGPLGLKDHFHWFFTEEIAKKLGNILVPKRELVDFSVRGPFSSKIIKGFPAMVFSSLNNDIREESMRSLKLVVQSGYSDFKYSLEKDLDLIDWEVNTYDYFSNYDGDIGFLENLIREKELFFCEGLFDPNQVDHGSPFFLDEDVLNFIKKKDGKFVFDLEKNKNRYLYNNDPEFIRKKFEKLMRSLKKRVDILDFPKNNDGMSGEVSFFTEFERAFTSFKYKDNATSFPPEDYEKLQNILVEEYVSWHADFVPTNTAQAFNVVAQSDIVILAVPLSEMDDVIKKYVSHVSKGSLLLDIASVKGKFWDSMVACAGEEVDLIGTHPLFGPIGAENLKGQKITLFLSKGQEKYRWFEPIKDFFEYFNLKLAVFTPNEHDKAVALTQPLLHAILISYLATVKDKGYNAEKMESFSTPIFRMQLGMASRLLMQKSDLYAQIAFQNIDHTLDAMKSFRDQFSEIIDCLEKNKKNSADGSNPILDYEKMIESTKSFYDSEENDLLKLFYENTKMLVNYNPYDFTKEKMND